MAYAVIGGCDGGDLRTLGVAVYLPYTGVLYLRSGLRAVVYVLSQFRRTQKPLGEILPLLQKRHAGVYIFQEIAHTA